MLTVTLVTLHQSEEWYWDVTPRLLMTLINESNKIKKQDMRLLAGYIACNVWGKEIPDDDLQPVKKGIAGVDYPLNQSDIPF